MSHENTSGPSIDTQNVPHSGKGTAPFERPLPGHESDVSLAEATRGVTLPDSTETLHPTPEEIRLQREVSELRTKEAKHMQSKRIATRVGIGAGAVAIATAGALALANNGDDSDPAPQVNPDTTVDAQPSPDATPAVPNKTPEPQPTDIPGGQETVGTEEVLIQTLSVEQMDAMSIEEFAALPYADRAAYAFLTVPELRVPSADESFEVKNVPGIVWQQLRQTAIGQADTVSGAKMISALTYYTTNMNTGEITDDYQAGVDSILATGGAGIGISDSFVYEDSGEPQSGTDRDGNPIEFTNVTYGVYEPNPDDFANPTKTGERTAQVITSVVVRLQDGRTIRPYPAGYNIDGKQSPVEGYPY